MTLAIGLLLAVMGVTPIVVGYVFVLRICDRFEPEPWWLLASAFGWGAVVAVVGSLLGEQHAAPLLATALGISKNGALFGALELGLIGPFIEETAKGLGMLLLLAVSTARLKELDGMLDGLLVGGTIGLGFTLTEDIAYATHAYLEQGIGGLAATVTIRTLFLGMGHATYTGLAGLGVGAAVELRRWSGKLAAPIAGFGGGLVLHSLNNSLTLLGVPGALGAVTLHLLTFAGFIAAVAILVVRDRSIVAGELGPEVGGTLDAAELALVTTYFKVEWHNARVLHRGGWARYRERRRKQLALVELAFLKRRRRRGERGARLDRAEHTLRASIARASAAGIRLDAC